MGINPYNSTSCTFGGTYLNSPPVDPNPGTAWPLHATKEKPSDIERFASNIFTPIQTNDGIKPDLTFRDFNQLTPENVRTQGNIRGMVFDVDDTLSKYHLSGNRTIPPELKQRLKTLQDSGIQLGIISNNPDSKLVRQFQDELGNEGIEVAVISNGQKPGTKSLEMMENYMGLPANQIMMVGDNPDTDVESGKKAGCKTVQVDWFHTSELHKDGMELGDKALHYVDKFKAFFDSNADQPQFFPPPQQSLPSAAVNA